MRRFTSARHHQRFVSMHEPVAKLCHIPRHNLSSDHHRKLRTAAIHMWNEIAHLQAA
jgi:putative transposase